MDHPFLQHDPICPSGDTLPAVEAKMYPGSGLGLCESCGAVLPVRQEELMHATPEPWTYEQFERDGLFGFRIMAGRIQIAEAYPRPDQVAVNEANFRLLVTAPRMRRLLNTLLLTGDDLSAVELCRLEASSILHTMENT